MTSKLTSRIVCTHSPNKGNFEFGGVSVKGSCGKARWNTSRQGDIWFNDLVPEDDTLTRNCYSNPISLQTSPDCFTNEHSEVDWISKEIAYQELICNDKAYHWPDVNFSTELVKEEHDMDIISTLTAVAALLQDWCVLEADLSQPVVEPTETSNSGDNVYHNEWLWKGDQSKVKKDLSMTSDVIRGSHYNVTWDDFIRERLQSQRMLYHSFYQPGHAMKEVECGNMAILNGPEDLLGSQTHADIGWYEGERAKEEFHLFEHLLHPIGKTIEMHNAFIENHCLEAGSATNTKGYIPAQQFGALGFQDLCAHYHVSPHLVASRYSFGREGDPSFRPRVGEMFLVGPTLSEQLENCLLGEGLILAETDGVDNVDVETGMIQQDLAFTHGTFYKFDAKKERENDSNAVEVVHEAMPFVLPYMCLHGLLAMERVCKSFRDWIRNDLLLWQRLLVQPPLSKNLTNDVLLDLASRSKGQLRCLNLVDCTKVTEAAVEQVVFSNPRLSKLSLPGCSRISADSVVKMVEVLSNQGHPGFFCLKQLRVRNIYGLTREHLRKLENMVGAVSSYHRKPQYYHNGHDASFCDDERPIDVEECPKCSNVRLVYDCTRENCQQKQGSKYQECRACFLCTVRCEECGRCINDNDFEETFSLDLLCSCCWLRLPKCATCSRPGCGRHADHFIRMPESTFFCGDCSGVSTDATGPEFHVHS